jgi:hypothetical protein
LFIEQYNIGEMLSQITDLILYESNQKKLNLNLNLSPEIPTYFCRWYAIETNIDQPIGKCCKIY